MSLDELNKMIKDCGFYEIETNFQERDTFIAYNTGNLKNKIIYKRFTMLAMMT